jgi:hypothetical protein
VSGATAEAADGDGEAGAVGEGVGVVELAFAAPQAAVMLRRTAVRMAALRDAESDLIAVLAIACLVQRKRPVVDSGSGIDGSSTTRPPRLSR